MSPVRELCPTATPLLPGAAERVAVRPQEWMGALDPSLRLDELTIPGSHDAGAVQGGRWVTCQQDDITAQLEAGVRYLDVRVRHHRDHFDIHHGRWFQGLGLDDVLASCAAFLKGHPTEGVLVCLTQEHSRSGPEELARTWARTRRRFDGLLHESRRLPTVAQARGKVVLVTRSAGFNGIEQSGWQVHDDWRIDSHRVWHGRKWPGVAQHLAGARAAAGDGRMWSCHASSNGVHLPPRAAARLLVERLERHFGELPRPAGQHGRPERNGVVLLDFVTPASSRLLWGRNF